LSGGCPDSRNRDTVSVVAEEELEVAGAATSVAVTIDAAIAATKRAGWTRDVFRLILDLRSIQWRFVFQI
jgi:hypothetical protein